MIGRITKSEFIPFGAFEPEVHVVLPGEADAAMHLHGTIGRACIYIRQIGFCEWGVLCVPRLFLGARATQDTR